MVRIKEPKKTREKPQTATGGSGMKVNPWLLFGATAAIVIAVMLMFGGGVLNPNAVSGGNAENSLPAVGHSAITTARVSFTRIGKNEIQVDSVPVKLLTNWNQRLSSQYQWVVPASESTTGEMAAPTYSPMLLNAPVPSGASPVMLTGSVPDPIVVEVIEVSAEIDPAIFTNAGLNVSESPNPNSYYVESTAEAKILHNDVARQSGLTEAIGNDGATWISFAQPTVPVMGGCCRCGYRPIR